MDLYRQWGEFEVLTNNLATVLTWCGRIFVLVADEGSHYDSTERHSFESTFTSTLNVLELDNSL